jgi:hypothetical protein
MPGFMLRNPRQAPPIPTGCASGGLYKAQVANSSAEPAARLPVGNAGSMPFAMDPADRTDYHDPPIPEIRA